MKFPVYTEWVISLILRLRFIELNDSVSKLFFKNLLKCFDFYKYENSPIKNMKNQKLDETLLINVNKN